MEIPSGVKITPMIKQYVEWKDRYPDCILFFRMGDFFEMFFKDAEIASGILGIALTARDPDRAIPMAGVPHHAVDAYLGKLIKAGCRVAVCDQISEPDGRGIVERRVVRLVTPGTYSPQDTPSEGRLASFVLSREMASAAIASPSTGRLEAGTFPMEEAISIVSLFDPAELLVPAGQEASVRDIFKDHDVPFIKTDDIITRERAEFDPAASARWLCTKWNIGSLAGMGFDDDDPAVGAAAAVLRYTEETQFSAARHMISVEPITSKDCLVMDSSTISSLELKNDDDLSLFKVLNRCRTMAGRRLLKEWLIRPSGDVAEITRRLDCVEAIAADRGRSNELSARLAEFGDIERAVGRICLGTGNPRDVAVAMTALRAYPEISALASAIGGAVADIFRSSPDLTDLSSMLCAGIAEDPPRSISSGGVIKDGFDQELDDLRKIVRSSEQMLRSFEESERERTGIKVRVGINKVFGYYIEVGKNYADKVPDDYIRRQTVSTGERFVNDALKDIERTALHAEQNIASREQELYDMLIDTIKGEAPSCRVASQLVARLDVLRSFAETAYDNAYVRPIVDTSRRFDIIGARHPVVERAMGRGAYTPNDICLDPDDQDAKGCIAILTGPNMAGKSTYLRTAALLGVMAHMGSFIPAESARIGLIDRIFTRVGARDELAKGKSTFMVEMTETANILRHAGPRSLVILDEVGRGTATYDGMSIAWAVVEFLACHIEGRTKALFATHYHELTELDLPMLFDLSMSVEESGDEIRFLHKVQDGPADRSYGVDVARLAGVPSIAVKRAREILAVLENDRSDIRHDLSAASSSYAQREIFFDVDREGIIEKLAKCDPDRMTPMEALSLVSELRKKSRKILELK